MKKISFKNIPAFLIGLLVIVALVNLAVAQEKGQEKGKEQFGETKGKLLPSEPVAPVKENICRNPKLCESLEIDMLDKLQKAKVPVYLPGPEGTTSAKDYKVALNLGIAVSDALACVINQDKTAFPKYAGMINDFAKKLGTPETVLSKYSKITEAASKGEWDKLGTLIYEFKDEITTELSKKNRQADATLAMVGGGLEGLYIVAKSVDQKFSPESANLLRNAEFGKYLEFNIKSAGPDLNAKEEIKTIMAALPKIDKIINKPKDYNYTPADGKELVNVCESLRKTLVSN